MKKRLAKQQAALERAKANAATLEDEITALQRKVLEAGGTRLKNAKAKAEAAGNKLDAAVSAVTKARVDIKTAIKNAEKVW
jgi:predicted  nucleic acid-binding Zn-ribbon protein